MSDSRIPHLVKTSEGGLNLGAAAGLERLSVEELHVPPGGSRPVPAAGEIFVYVLSGEGMAHGQGESLHIGQGDFLSAELEPGERLSIENPHDGTLVVLAGGESARYP